MTGCAWSERYRMLDAWRGIAATMVVIHHVAGIPIGHDAVMLFFVISGYCISASAEVCLTKELAFRTFMWRRVRRIFPPYLLALAFFVATRLLKLAMGGPNDLARTPVEWVQNLTLTQWLTLLFRPTPLAEENPTNFVAAFWSLNYEEQFYLVVALAILPAFARFRTVTLSVLM